MVQQFQVPQFIEREARLIGPLTIKQSAILGGVGAIVFVLWFTVEKILFFPLAILIAVGALLFAFLKINGRPLSSFFASFFSFFVSPQLYIWQKRKGTKKKEEKFVKKQTSETEESKQLTKKDIVALVKRMNKN